MKRKRKILLGILALLIVCFWINIFLLASLQNPWFFFSVICFTVAGAFVRKEVVKIEGYREEFKKYFKADPIITKRGELIPSVERSLLNAKELADKHGVITDFRNAINLAKGWGFEIPEGVYLKFFFSEKQRMNAAQYAIDHEEEFKRVFIDGVEYTEAMYECEPSFDDAILVQKLIKTLDSHEIKILEWDPVHFIPGSVSY